MRMDNTMLYQKIKLHLREEVLKKAELGTEIRLDAERKMAEDMGVSRSSINKAISELTAEGYLIKKRGIGVYIPSKEYLQTRESQLNTIALILPNTNDYYYAEIAREIEKIAFESNIQLILSLTGNDASKEKALLEGITANRMVKGVIAVPVLSDPNTSAYRRLHLSGIPVVLINRIHESMLDIPYIIYNQGEGSELAVQHLAEQGRNNMLFVGDEQDGYHARLRKQGFDRAAERLADIHTCQLYDNDSNYEHKLTEMVAQHSINGIVAFNDIIAIRAMNILINNGCSIPDQVAIIGHDDSSLCDIALSPLTSVRFPKKMLAAQSFDLLFNLVQKKPCNPQLTIPSSLEVRQSSSARLPI
ncbi:GntR family transcriptional regulator [Paenibacillus sp. GCM10023252]|uniref:GntR family transcriptional regulator n=1 Tax=Paenibacillus sp. GCM10023252 TaxID=3252649 RepID=UPI0036210D3B